MPSPDALAQTPPPTYATPPPTYGTPPPTYPTAIAGGEVSQPFVPSISPPVPRARRRGVALGLSVGYRAAIDIATDRPYRKLLARYGHGELDEMLELRLQLTFRVLKRLELGLNGTYLLSVGEPAGTLGDEGMTLHVLEGAAFLRPILFRGGDGEIVSLELAAGTALPSLHLRGEAFSSPVFSAGPALVVQSRDKRRVGAQVRIGYNFARWSVGNTYAMQLGGLTASLGLYTWL